MTAICVFQLIHMREVAMSKPVWGTEGHSPCTTESIVTWMGMHATKDRDKYDASTVYSISWLEILNISIIEWKANLQIQLMNLLCSELDETLRNLLEPNKDSLLINESHLGI